MSSATDSNRFSTSAKNFIEEARFHELLKRQVDASEVRDVLAKSMAKTPLSIEETAVLLAADAPELVQEVFEAARQLKRDVYGNRIVLFAPLYIGNECVNDCQYCAFRRSNQEAVRRTLSEEQIRQQVEALLAKGHKRLILVFGEHRNYDPEFIAQCVRHVYSIQHPHGKTGHAETEETGLRPAVRGTATPSSIRRVNINAAPLDHEGFRIVKEAGIGTYQIFQETYHQESYSRYHPAGTLKADYAWRLDGVARAMEAGADDVGIGCLFGLYDWRFEVLGLVAHALHLQEHYNVGPHTISFPRLRPASGVQLDTAYAVNDQQFKRLVAILRLAVPYTGLILTAREPAALRREVMAFGVSQIDAGSRIELGGYTEAGDTQVLQHEQFELGDIRPLDEVMRELLQDGYIPSFCTACYRLGRTGEHFMEFAIPGFIQNLCTPNALLTLTEFLIDHASPETRAVGERAIRDQLDQIPESARKQELVARLQNMYETGERDLYF
ncbi:MAG: [FeFe] hydrogenase H-cluster radical SAM maturase HydG [Planctomycetota bacterium]